MKESQSTVVRAVQRLTETSCKRSGRSQVTYKNEDKYTVVTSKRQQSLTAPDVQ